MKPPSPRTMPSPTSPKRPTSQRDLVVASLLRCPPPAAGRAKSSKAR